MTDLIDLCQIQHAYAEEHLLDEVRAALGDGPSATGQCLWCESPLINGNRWCDKDCRDDWSHSQARAAINIDGEGEWLEGGLAEDHFRFPPAAN